MSLWADIEHSITATRCRCALAPNMTHAQLAELGGGCTMPQFACGTLAKYRRLLPKGRVEDQGWSPEETQVRRAND